MWRNLFGALLTALQMDAIQQESHSLSSSNKPKSGLGESLSKIRKERLNLCDWDMDGLISIASAENPDSLVLLSLIHHAEKMESYLKVTWDFVCSIPVVTNSSGTHHSIVTDIVALLNMCVKLKKTARNELARRGTDHLKIMYGNSNRYNLIHRNDHVDSESRDFEARIRRNNYRIRALHYICKYGSWDLGNNTKYIFRHALFLLNSANRNIQSKQKKAIEWHSSYPETQLISLRNKAVRFNIDRE